MLLTALDCMHTSEYSYCNNLAQLVKQARLEHKQALSVSDTSKHVRHVLLAKVHVATPNLRGVKTYDIDVLIMQHCLLWKGYAHFLSHFRVSKMQQFSASP